MLLRFGILRVSFSEMLRDSRFEPIEGSVLYPPIERWSFGAGGSSPRYTSVSHTIQRYIPIAARIARI